MKIRLLVSQSNWFTDLTEKAKKLYLKEHPESKYAKQLGEPSAAKQSVRKMEVYFIKDVDRFVQIVRVDPKRLFKHFFMKPSPPYDMELHEVTNGVTTGKTLDLSRSALDAAHKENLIGTRVMLVEFK